MGHSSTQNIENGRADGSPRPYISPYQNFSNSLEVQSASAREAKVYHSPYQYSGSSEISALDAGSTVQEYVPEQNQANLTSFTAKGIDITAQRPILNPLQSIKSNSLLGDIFDAPIHKTILSGQSKTGELELKTKYPSFHHYGSAAAAATATSTDNKLHAEDTLSASDDDATISDVDSASEKPQHNLNNALTKNSQSSHRVPSRKIIPFTSNNINQSISRAQPTTTDSSTQTASSIPPHLLPPLDTTACTGIHHIKKKTPRVRGIQRLRLSRPRPPFPFGDRTTGA